MQTFPRGMRPIIQYFAIFAAIFFAASVSRAQVRIQKAPAEPQTQPPFADDLSKNPELLKELAISSTSSSTTSNTRGREAKASSCPSCPTRRCFTPHFPTTARHRIRR